MRSRTTVNVNNNNEFITNKKNVYRLTILIRVKNSLIIRCVLQILFSIISFKNSIIKYGIESYRTRKMFESNNNNEPNPPFWANKGKSDKN